MANTNASIYHSLLILEGFYEDLMRVLSSNRLIDIPYNLAHTQLVRSE